MIKKIYAPQVDRFVDWLGYVNRGGFNDNCTFTKTSYELIDNFFELLKKISFNPILLSSENYEMSIGDSPTVRIIGVPLDFFTYTEGLNSESEAFWKTFTALFPVNCLITVLYSDIEYITQFKEMKVISEKVFGRSSDLFLCRKNCSGFVEKSLTEGNLLNIDDEGTDIIYRVIKSLHINLSSIE